MVNTDCQARGGYESRICSWHQTKAQGREICRQLVGKDRQLWSWPTNYSLEPGLDPPFRDFVVSVHCQLSPCPLGLAPVQLFIWTDLAGGPCHQHFYWSTTPYRRLWHPWLERWWLFGGCCVNSDCLGVVTSFSNRVDPCPKAVRTTCAISSKGTWSGPLKRGVCRPLEIGEWIAPAIDSIKSPSHCRTFVIFSLALAYVLARLMMFFFFFSDASMNMLFRQWPLAISMCEADRVDKKHFLQKNFYSVPCQ